MCRCWDSCQSNCLSRLGRGFHLWGLMLNTGQWSRRQMQMDVPPNIFSKLPATLPQELIQVLLTTPNIRIERIISRGHVSPEGFWYDQPASEWVLLVHGAARLRVEGEELFEMRPGSFVNIPAHKRHRVEWTDPAQATIWLAIHYS